jgi:aspartate 1-decarboxylase
MTRTMLKSKIHRATVTDADLNYEGSITIDERLMKAANLLEHEQVAVWNVNNGERFETYVIPGPRDSGTICVNGSAARKVHRGDLLIIASFAGYDEQEARRHKPTVILVDARNRMRRKPGAEVQAA